MDGVSAEVRGDLCRETRDAEAGAGAEKQEAAGDIAAMIGGQVRGIGTDVAIVSAMVFLAQFILSSLMGSIVQLVGGTQKHLNIISTSNTLCCQARLWRW